MSYFRQTVLRVFDKFERLLYKAAVSLMSLDLISCSTLDERLSWQYHLRQGYVPCYSIRLPSSTAEIIHLKASTVCSKVRRGSAEPRFKFQLCHFSNVLAI